MRVTIGNAVSDDEVRYWDNRSMIKVTSTAFCSSLRLRGQERDTGVGAALSLTSQDYAEILNMLRASATSYDARRNLLMLALEDGESHEGLLQYCKTLLQQASTTPGFSGYEAASNVALQLLLAKSPDKGMWVRQFGQSKYAVLRLAVAEHVFASEPQRALLSMIETIPLAGTDHAVTDAIDLWLSNEASTQLLAEVDARLASLAKTQADSALTAAFMHARKVIADECT